MKKLQSALQLENSRCKSSLSANPIDQVPWFETCWKYRHAIEYYKKVISGKSDDREKRIQSGFFHITEWRTVKFELKILAISLCNWVSDSSGSVWVSTYQCNISGAHRSPFFENVAFLQCATKTIKTLTRKFWNKFGTIFNLMTLYHVSTLRKALWWCRKKLDCVTAKNKLTIFEWSHKSLTET